MSPLTEKSSKETKQVSRENASPENTLESSHQPPSSLSALHRALGNRTVQKWAEKPISDPDTVVDTALKGLTGSGGELPHLSVIQRAFGRHDVSQVRAHQGAHASSAARAIGARAFASGNHVAFSGSPDLRTAAHEATHVIQQRAGVQLENNVGRQGDTYERHADAVAEKVAAGGSAEELLNRMSPQGSRALGIQKTLIQRAPIPTDYGDFDTTKFNKLGPAGNEYGLDVEITFDPDKTKVDAEKIGLTQSIRYELSGKDVALYPVAQDRMVASGPGKGTQIDRYAGAAYGNPLYAANMPGATDKLGDTPTVAGWGQHGWNYTDKAGKPQHQKAILKDTPALPGRGNNSGQYFETAALAVEGTQSGTYMGSVTWGWSVDAKGKFTTTPLTISSKGLPSEGFMAAAKQWNTTSVGGTVKTVSNPTQVYDNAFSASFTVAKDTEMQIMGDAFTHSNEVYNNITVNSGKDKGRTGLVKVTDMKETGGRSVIPLPVYRKGTITVNPSLGSLATLREAPSHSGKTLADLPVGSEVIVMDDSKAWVLVEVDTGQAGVILNAYSRARRDPAGRLRGYVSQELIQ